MYNSGGLDSYAALQVVQYLKKLADANHTIVLTIHQPEAAIWNLIDDLVLLSEGYTLYHGPTERVRCDLQSLRNIWGSQPAAVPLRSG